jgi:parallel beta-helix repeat protein
MARVALALSLSSVLLSVSVDAFAKACGGSTTCECGDTVVENYVLTHDLGPCPERGLLIEPGVHFDGGGHTITGINDWDSDTFIDQHGIHVADANLTERKPIVIRNVKVTKFGKGIRIENSNSVVLRRVTTFGNGIASDSQGKPVGYGIDIAAESHHNKIYRATVIDNADEGIHFGSGTHSNIVDRVTISRSGKENLYFLRSSKNIVIDSQVLDIKGLGLYMKNSHENVFRGNTFSKSFHIIGDSHDNFFGGTKIRGNIRIADYLDQSTGEYQYPYRNKFLNISITNIYGDCIHLFNTWDNKFSRIDALCKGEILAAEGESLPADRTEALNRFSLMDLPSDRVDLDNPNSLAYVFTLRAQIVYKGEPVPSGTVELRDPVDDAVVARADISGGMASLPNVAAFKYSGAKEERIDFGYDLFAQDESGHSALVPIPAPISSAVVDVVLE